jgi:hypothetical protein
MIPDAKVVDSTLNLAPGPLPWYGRSAGDRIYGRGLDLEWVYAEDIGQSLLVERSANDGPRGPAFGVGKIYTYPKSLSTERFALWWQKRNPYGWGAVQFRVFDASGLHPIKNWRDDWNVDSDCLIGAPELASFYVPADLSDGINRVALPGEFAFTDEILILVNRAATGIDLCIWRVDTGARQITVLPQRWWSEGDADFGYQWITRVAVEPTSGLIIGDGIRISPFVLDASGLKRAG